MSLPKIYVRDSIYIPIKFIDTDLMKERYTERFYDENICRQCPYVSDRHSYLCDECELGGYKDKMTFYHYKNIKGVRYAALPLGDKHRLPKVFNFSYSDFKIVDKRTNKPFDYKIKFTGKLREYQYPLFDGYLKHRFGIIKAPPRTGKTVTSIAILIALGQRCVITANQVDYLRNFIEEIELYTNLPELQKKSGKKLYGFLDKPEDFETVQIGLATYQSFISQTNGKKRKKLLDKHFGTVYTDEIHKANAKEYSKFLASTISLYRGGCTATEKRKDKRHIAIRRIIGPIVGETDVETLVPKISVHITKAVPKPGAYSRGPAAWTNANKFLSKHPQRMKLLIDGIENDLNNGRSILLGVYFRDHVNEIVKAINVRMGKTIAYAFTGGGAKKNKEQRKEVIKLARSGKIRVVVGIRSLIQVGLNVPRWDTLYYLMPMNNEPNWEQESKRICTPDETGKKKSPLIRMFVDPELGISLGCFRHTFKQSLKLGHKPTRAGARKAKLLGINGTADDKGRFDDSGMYDSENRERSNARKKKPQKPKVAGSLFGRCG